MMRAFILAMILIAGVMWWREGFYAGSLLQQWVLIGIAVYVVEIRLALAVPATSAGRLVHLRIPASNVMAAVGNNDRGDKVDADRHREGAAPAGHLPEGVSSRRVILWFSGAHG